MCIKTPAYVCGYSEHMLMRPTQMRDSESDGDCEEFKKDFVKWPQAVSIVNN